MAKIDISQCSKSERKIIKEQRRIQKAVSQLKKDEYINQCVEYMLQNYPDRTTTTEKCHRDLSIIFDAFVNGLTHSIRDYALDIGAMFWHKGERQIVQYDVEFAVYKKLVEIVSNNHPKLAKDIEKFVNIFTVTIIIGPRFKLGNSADTKLTKKILNLAYNRHNWKPLIGDRPSENDLEIILRAASGSTPALSNEYNYRVDEVPDKFKESLYQALAQHSQAAEESGNPGYAHDYNPQLMAPLVLCFSLRYNQTNKNIEQFCGDMTVRDPNMINIGVSLWHTVIIAESLGYKTAFCQVTSWKRDRAKEILGLHTDELQSEHLIKKNGECTFMPMVFLCIGTDGKSNLNTRSSKYEDIANKLRFND